MTKVAAFLPALGLTGGAALAAGAALTGVGMLGQRAAMNKVRNEQEAINNQWIAFQNQKKAQAEASDAARREDNYGRLDEFLSGADQQSREQVIDEEAARLTEGATASMPDPEAPVGDDLIKGATFGSQVFKDYAGDAIAKATREARDLLAARSKVAAYGGSFGGMGTTRNEAMGDAASRIGFNNEMRGIDAGTLARWQSVQPEILQYQDTGLADLLTGLGGNMMGQGFFSMGGGAVPAGAPTTATTGSAWTPTAPVVGTRGVTPGLTFGPTIAPMPVTGSPRLRFGLGGY